MVLPSGGVYDWKVVMEMVFTCKFNDDMCCSGYTVAILKMETFLCRCRAQYKVPHLSLIK